MKKEIFELKFCGKTITVEIGELAKQADGSVLVRYEDTVVLTTVTRKEEMSKMDFFPLMVLYYEKLYAVGKIPGGFIKREGRPSDNATLAARLIDRPIRPLFPEGFKNEVQIVNNVLSVNQDISPEMTALFGSSLALGISSVPFDGPVAGVLVGRKDGKLIINPSIEEMDKSDLTLSVAGTKTAINMVESSSSEISEEEILEAIMFGHEHIKQLVAFQEKIISNVGKKDMEYEVMSLDSDLELEVKEYCQDNITKAIKIKDKLKSQEAKDTVAKNAVEYFENKYSTYDDLEEILNQVKKIIENIEKHIVRKLITKDKVRPDGRKITEIRPLNSQIDILPRTHGSALFTRGQTQVLSITTLGAIGEHQILDGLGIEEAKRFMHHYNFPPFSVGETGRYGAPGRREIGHGALGERALQQVMPTEAEFPYTIRIVSEVLESNGSSSQASICAGCMSLMAAGVPIKAPVAGIAMGLIAEENDYTILTDIQGLEDHLGDMDFKVAGTKKGICALQMDIKIAGITEQILKEALDQAKKGRMEILKNMEKAIDKPRKELSEYAPKIEQMQIDPSRIKDVIGRGGETITNLILEVSGVPSVTDPRAVKIDIEDDGRVIIYHTDYEVIKRAKNRIEELTREVELGKVYTGTVTRVEEFGCFVMLWPGCEGLCHISQLALERVEKTTDVVKVGDSITVKAKGYDKKGRLDLSRKDAIS